MKQHEESLYSDACFIVIAIAVRVSSKKICLGGKKEGVTDFKQLIFMSVGNQLTLTAGYGSVHVIIIT